MNNRTKTKVLLALSGGVDSAVAAWLLQKRGFDVTAAFMKMWSDEAGILGHCPYKEDRRDACKVASRLGIPIIVLDFENEYRREVLSGFFESYARGETPNPDIFCNSRIKFPFLRRTADDLGIRFVATGHYARLRRDKQGRTHLLKARDREKDQTYFLSDLTKADLANTIFPIGQLVKSEVRAIAKKAGLTVHDKRSTRGICFVGKVSLPKFLRQKIQARPGKIISQSGETLGRHQDISSLTVGQRHGVGLGGGRPYYVTQIDIKENTVFVSADEKDLYQKTARLRDIHWISGAPAKSRKLFARPRYRAELSEVVLENDLVVFKKPQRALTPGQSVVFYSGAECLGQGIIKFAKTREK